MGFSSRLGIARLSENDRGWCQCGIRLDCCLTSTMLGVHEVVFILSKILTLVVNDTHVIYFVQSRIDSYFAAMLGDLDGVFNIWLLYAISDLTSV